MTKRGKNQGAEEVELQTGRDKDGAKLEEGRD